MNRISTILLLLVGLGTAAVSTACSGDDEDPNGDPGAQTSEITEIDKTAAQTDQTPTPVSTTDVTQHASLTQTCDTCGPLPDPWKQGPLPDPWAQSSTSGGTSTTTGTTTTTGHK